MTETQHHGLASFLDDFHNYTLIGLLLPFRMICVTYTDQCVFTCLQTGYCVVKATHLSICYSNCPCNWVTT